MAKELNINLIPKEKLALANRGDHIKDQKFEDKPIGYFEDAWRRFCKNKASIIAAIIIICIVLFAVIVPFFNPGGIGTNQDSYYKRKGPRNLFFSQIGLFTGDVVREQANANSFIHAMGMGIGSDLDFDNIPTIGESLKSESNLHPVTSLDRIVEVQQGRKTNLMYTYTVDEYLEVGFIYRQITREEYAKILAWEEENSTKVIYPLINTTNDYCYAASDANWWYKTNEKGAPMHTNSSGNVVLTKYDDINDLQLEDNYKRDAEGNLVYWEYTGGGDHDTAEYNVRVLYYNYYRYLHDGREAEFFFGTDRSGYDLAYRMAVGIRLSLILSVCIFVINFVLGAMYGAVEGYYGGYPDLIMEFIAYVLSGIPFMVVATLFQIHLAAKAGPIPSLLFAFVLTGWIGTASLVRTQFYRFKNQEYVMAARTLGAKDGRVIWKHIFPNTLGTIITSSVLAIPGVIFSESMLSYLGIINLGSSTITSLGTLLSDASDIWTSTPHLMLFPAGVISLLMICFNLFGNGLRDAFNPSLRGTEE